MKEKITKGLSIKDKSIRNNLLKIYPHIENLNNNDMEKPMKLIENNIIYENDRNIFDNSVEILNNFLEKNRNMKVNSELTNGLIEYISENDYNVYNEENKKIDDEYEDKKNIFEKIKDEVDKEVRKQLIETLKINDEKTKIELKKHFKKKNYDLDKKQLQHSQKEKRNTTKKIFQCINNIAQNEKGLSEKVLNQMNNLLETSQNENTEDYYKFIKKNVIKTVNKVLEYNKNSKIPGELVDNISNEIGSKHQKKIFKILDKVSDNQNLQTTATKNLFNVLEDNIQNIKEEDYSSSSLNSSVSENMEEDEKYEKSYKIINKNKNNLNENQKKVLSLVENSQNLKYSKNENSKTKNLDNIINIIQDGYKINKYSEKIVSNLIKNNENDIILQKSVDVFDEMAKNKIELGKNATKLIMDKFDNKNKLSKKSFIKLMSCLINIIDNCKVPQGCIKIFENILKQYKNNEDSAEIELVIKGLSLLSKKHYLLNVEEINICLDIIENNKLEDKLINELISILDIIFKEANILNSTFNKLFNIMMRNIKLYDKFSKYLLDSLKFKEIKEKQNIINNNINNIEELIKRKQLNDNIINLILSLEKNFYSERKIIKDFYEFDKYCKIESNLKEDNYKFFQSYVTNYGIVHEKYFNLLYNNLDETYSIIIKILENNSNALAILEYSKLFNKNNTKIENSLNIILQFFDNNKINNENIRKLIYITINNNEEKIYVPIQKIFKLLSNEIINALPEEYSNVIKIENLDSNNINNDNINLIKNFMENSSSIPERYFLKIYNSLEKYEQNIQIYFLNLLIYLLNKDITIPVTILNKFMEEKNVEKIYGAVGVNIKDYISIIFEKIFCNIRMKNKYFNSIKTFFEKNENELIGKTLKNVKNKIEFNIIDEYFKKIIISNFSKMASNISDYKLILYWMYSSNTITTENNNMIISELKKTDFWSDLNQIENFNSTEEMKNFLLEEVQLENIINELSNKDNKIKDEIYSSINIIRKKEQKNISSLIKLLRIINCQKTKYNWNNELITKCFNYLKIIEIDFSLNFVTCDNNNYLDSLRKKWIKKLLIINKIQINDEDIIFLEKIADNLIEYFTFLVDSQNNFKTLLLYLKNNKSLKDEIFKLCLTLKNNNNSIETLLNEITLVYIKNKINYTLNDIHELFILCFVKINWKIIDIIKFIKSDINFEDINSEFLSTIIIPIIINSNILYESKNNKNENLILIFKNYDKEDWELMIKDLIIEQSLKGIDENNLDIMIDLLLEKNKGKISENLIQKIKNLIEKTRYCFNTISKTGISNKKICEYEDNEILAWSKSIYTKNNIKSENFFPEALAVIDRALEKDTNGHRIRNVQLASIFLILLSPKNKGLFAQIKTGEGKSNIVACIAIVKALQIEYVDILSSSIVLSMRDAEEKLKFYNYFGLTCSSTAKTINYSENIIYGDTLGFEGDILRYDFHSEGKYKGERNYRCLIVDEVDSMCIDHLGDSTRLCAPFPSYEFLNVFYPFIYNSLREIDNGIDNGLFGEIKIENRKDFACERLKLIINEFISNNKLNNELKLIIPDNLKKFIQLQIPHWCENAYKAKHFMKLDKDYVLGKREIDDEERENLKENNLIPTEYFRICPVDFFNTGVISQTMVWSNGLAQFLQIKHGLKLDPENLTTTYLSHHSFIRRYINEQYGNNIYGVTGTLGMESSQNLLKNLFEVEIYIIPPFRPSRLNVLQGISNFDNESEWKNEIIKNIIHHTYNLNRTVLVISLTIEESNLLYDELSQNEIYKKYNLSLYKYQRNDINENQLKSKYGTREVIFATNLAGRGTDIGLLETVGKNGGMHVIITFIPENSRIEEQALGRTARSGAKGSAIIIPNKKENIKYLKKIRDEKENKRMENIQNKKIKEIKIKDELFQKFTFNYKKIKKNYYNSFYLTIGQQIFEVSQGNKELSEAVGKDVEESWGLWLQENFENNKINFDEKTILNSFNLFEKEIDNIYKKEKSDLIQFQNPYNYFTFENYQKAFDESKDICFYANYLKNMKEINNTTSYSYKKEAIKNIEETINSVKNSIIPQLGSSSLIAEHIKNYITNLNKKELSIDIEAKVNSLQSLLNILEQNKSKIENVLNNDKAKIFSYQKNLQKVTKFKNVLLYLNDVGINCYYEIDVEIEKDWFGIFFTFFLGACEIIAGCFLQGIGLGNIGLKLINEGIEDIEYGFDCLLGNKQFNWKELGKRKMAFVIKIITSETLKWVFNGFKNPFNKIDLSGTTKSNGVKQYFNVVKDKVIEVGKKKVINYVVSKCLGPNFFDIVVKELKKFVKKISNKFSNKLKKILNEKYSAQIKQMIIFDTIDQNSSWGKYLSTQLKIALKCLSRILNLFVKTILNLKIVL